MLSSIDMEPGRINQEKTIFSCNKCDHNISLKGLSAINKGFAPRICELLLQKNNLKISQINVNNLPTVSIGKINPAYVDYGGKKIIGLEKIDPKCTLPLDPDKDF